MYRIWIGLNPRLVLSGVFSGLFIFAIVIHMVAFNAVNYPSGGNEKYHAMSATK